MQADFRLGDWLVQPALCRLSKDGETVQVRAKVMDLLAYLAERPGEVIPKDRLLDGVWGSQAVSESALTRTVTELRQALGDDAGQPPARDHSEAWLPAHRTGRSSSPNRGRAVWLAPRVSSRRRTVLAVGALAAV